VPCGKQRKPVEFDVGLSSETTIQHILGQNNITVKQRSWSCETSKSRRIPNNAQVCSHFAPDTFDCFLVWH